jgi:uncharacterized membrane protein
MGYSTLLFARKILINISILGIFLWLLPLSLFTSFAQTPQSDVYEATITSIKQTDKINLQTKAPIRTINMEITSGKLKGRTFNIQDNTVPTNHQIDYQKGTKVIVTYSKDPQGSEVIYITDVARQTPLLLLLLIFILLTIVVGRLQGVTSIIGMTISFVVIGNFIVPNILIGNNPVLITFFGAVLIIPTTYYISHGLNKKTTIAIIGTFITLLFTGILAYFFVNLAHLSGYSSEEASYLQNIGPQIDIKSILLSGFLIGILAVLNDITVSQASIVNSLFKAKPSLSVKELYTNAMSVGKDHIASLVNTLILVYAGASLPLFILFSSSNGPWNLVINQEVIAAEVIRTLISSIGIIAAVPLTTYLAALAYKKKLF